VFDDKPMSTIDIAVPDEANFDFGGDPIPDNFLDETISKAVTQHSRKESQVLSIKDDFSKIVDVEVADSLAQNLMGDRINRVVAPEPFPIDPDEDDVRVGIEQRTEPSGPQLEDMLIATVTEHQRKESRTDYLKSKLHEMFPQNEDDDEVLDGINTAGGGVGPLDMGQIANNLVAFLHDEPDSAAPTAMSNGHDHGVELQGNGGRHKARGSTDLSAMQQEIQRLQSTVRHLEYELSTKGNNEEELSGRVMELEDRNHDLMKQIEYLQNSKTKLAVESTKCIDQLRGMLVSYQTNLGLDQ